MVSSQRWVSSSWARLFGNSKWARAHYDSAHAAAGRDTAKFQHWANQATCHEIYGESVEKTGNIPRPLKVLMMPNQTLQTVFLSMETKSNPFLSDSQLSELCGLTQGFAQVKFLQRAYGLYVPRRPDGRVRVTWDAINESVKSSKTAPGVGPKWTK